MERMLPRKMVLATAAVLALLVNAESGADIYKYQDENGKWHFTDKPPAKGEGTSVTTSSSDRKLRDFRQELEDEFSPEGSVNRAMLSVITVETVAGSGSGFFITDDGYIITNRHVVRPSTSTQAKDTEQDLAERRQKLDTMKAELEYEEERLKDVGQSLQEEREYVESMDADDPFRVRHERSAKMYILDKDRYKKGKERYRKAEREYQEAKSEFGFVSNLTNFSRKFKITLKNGKTAKARLVRISKNYDLALLKLDNSATPYLELSPNRRPRQGTEVFAIGSPLGISDALTTGIITKSDDEFLFTDTQILPGNSGGPLIDGEGRVLGVNTSVVSSGEVSTGGLGLAIYAQHIREEFARELKGRL